MIDAEIFETMLFCHGVNGRIGLPLLVEGPPGTGKTQNTKALCHDFGLHCIPVLLRLYPQSELVGMPFITETDVDFRMPRWAKQAIAHKHALVLFDEFNTCEADSHAAALRVINEGVVGNTELPREVRFMCLQNPIEQATGGVDLPMAMANRLCHQNAIVPSPRATREYLSQLNVMDKTTTPVDTGLAIDRMAIVDREWSQAIAWAGAVVGTFLERNPELIHQPPEPNTPEASKGWPSNRSWELVTRALASARIHKLGANKELAIVEGFVGKGPTVEFAAFRSEMDLPDAQLLLDGGAIWRHDRDRPDRTYVVLQACTALLREDPKCKENQPRASALWKLCRDVVHDGGSDLVLDTVQWLNLNQLYDQKYCSEVIEKVMPMLNAAGLGGG
jgi:hypothetical protein